jgi:DNA-binding NtrC family response regulator
MPPVPSPVVLVDDEQDLLDATGWLLGSHGIAPIISLGDGRELLPLLARASVGMILLDLFMPAIGGLELLPKVVEAYPEVPVVVMTAAQDVDTAVACMREGAFDYLVKPVEESRLVSAVKRALEVGSLRRQLGTLRSSLLSRRLQHPEAFAEIVTANRGMEVVFQYIEAIAESREPVLIAGETGTGKELLAQAIHRLSALPGELVCISIAGLDDNLFADTLFGHVRGAFTGAERDRDGAIARAAGGTLFLDEIGDLSKASQVKLLRLLQEQRYYPLGSDLQRQSQARIVAATNQPLHQRMARGKFRQDLYFRLSSHPIEVPPLRRRRDDIPLLLQHFIDAAAESLGRPAPSPPAELITLLGVHEFPGNVRELRAMVYNAMALHRAGPTLSLDSFRNLIVQGRGPHAGSVLEAGADDEPPLAISGRFPTLKQANAFLIDEAMRRARDNQGIAAMLLGITRQSLNRRLSNRQRS